MTDCAAELSPGNPRLARVEAVLGALVVLRDLGLGLAQGLVDEAGAGPDGAAQKPTSAEAALAYARISRAVRMSCVLELRVAQEREEVLHGIAEQAAAAQRQALDKRRRLGFDRMEDAAIVVDQQIEAFDGPRGDDGTGNGEEASRLRQGVDEWLHDEEEHEYEDFAQMGEDEVLASLCQALGVTPDPTLWAKGEFAQAIRAGIAPKLDPTFTPPLPHPRDDERREARYERALDLADPP
jgi:hypothetical protein